MPSRLLQLIVLLSGCLLTLHSSAQTITLNNTPLINTAAGTPLSSGYSGDGGPAGLAQLTNPYGVAVDASGNYYIADTINNVIRVVNTQTTVITVAGVQVQPGDIATVAGNGQAGFSGDNGPATTAELDDPFAVAVDGSGDIFISDIGSDVIRMVSSSGTITTFAGTSTNAGGCDFTNSYSGDGGPATQAQMACPYGVAVDASGNVYIADTFNNVVRMVNTSGVINTVAGNGTGYGQGCGSGAYSGDGGSATSAELNCPFGVAVDAAGNFYINDTYNNAIRVVNTQTSAISIANVQIQPGDINTVAGNGTAGYSGDNGPSTQAQVAFPWRSSVDSQGNIFIADTGNYVVREVNVGGTISTYAGDNSYGFSGDGGPANQAQLSWVGGIAVTAVGNVYIADTSNDIIRMATPGGGMSQDFGQVALGSNNNQFVQILFHAPITINAVQAGGDFIVRPGCGDCESIHRQNTRNFDVAELHLPQSLSRLIQKQESNRVRSKVQFHHDTQPNSCVGTYQQGSVCFLLVRFTPTQPGYRTVPVIFTDSNSVQHSIGLTGTGVGSTLAFTPGMISFAAGDGTFGYSGDGGPALNAELAEPLGTVRDGAGNLYIADGRNNVIRKVDTSGNIWTIAGNGTAGYSGDGGPATSAQLAFPFGLSMDSGGNLYIADIMNSVIRKVDVNGIITTVAGNGTTGYTGDGGLASSAELDNPVGVVVDNAGDIYIADTFNNVIRKVNPFGIISTVAGNGFGAGTGGWDSMDGQGGYSGDGGPATQAEFFVPFGVALDTAGNIYISDSQNSLIRKVNTGGTISTVAGECPNGTCVQGYSGDGGPATSAQLAFPVAVGFDTAGEMFIADSYNSAVRRVDLVGNISTVAGDTQTGNVVHGQSSNHEKWHSRGNLRPTLQVNGPGSGGVATSTPLGIPASVTFDNAGNFYFSDAEADVVWQVNVTTSLLPFGNELVGGSTDPQSVTASNIGNATLNLSQISVASGFADIGTGQSACSSSSPVAVGANCTLTLTFNPTEQGSYNGTVALSDDAFNTPQSVSLTGVGTVNGPVDSALGFVAAPPANLHVGGAVGIIKVGIYNSNSNLDTNATASVTVTITGPNSFSSVKTQQASAGIATLDFSQVVLPVAGTYSVQTSSGSLSPASVNIVVVGSPDYDIAANPSSLTIIAGNSGSVTLTVTPTGGYAGKVNFACSKMPLYSTCTFEPAVATLNGSNTPVTVKLTVDTSGAGHIARLEAPPIPHRSPMLPASLWFVQTGLAGMLIVGSASDRKRRIWLRLGLLIVFFAAMLLVTGCGGTSQAGTGNSTVNVVTPTGNYTSTVTASASGGSGSGHSVDVKITIVE